MDLPTVTANPNATIRYLTLGAEKQPLLIVDDFIDNPEVLVESACRQQFHPEKRLYPGHRCPSPASYTRAMESFLPPVLAEVFGTKAGDITQVESSFSLVTQPPHTLQPLQRMPHFDSKNPKELASIFFLCNRHDSQYGGTAFYRHRQTGYEFISQPRFETFARSIDAHVRENGYPVADYIRADTDLFEQIASVPARFNRLVLYRCTSLHSGLIGRDFDFSTDPRNARLSINTFLVN